MGHQSIVPDIRTAAVDQGLHDGVRHPVGGCHQAGRTRQLKECHTAATHPAGIPSEQHSPSSLPCRHHSALQPSGRRLKFPEEGHLVSVRDCEGRWVRSLRDQVVTFTGTVRIDGVHVTRRECEERVRAKNGITATDFSGYVTLLVEGDLDGKHVTDPSRGYSKKLVGAHRARATGGPHVHVVDVEAFADLLDGIPARCRNLRGSGDRILVAPEPGDGILGGPVQPRRAGKRDIGGLRLNLDALDAGTEAHEETVRALREHLAGRGLVARRPSRGAPLFDIGWENGRQLFIGEVKSLRSTNQDQQIRLGVGQLLDYAHQMGGRHASIRSVLVLERRPTDDRWAGLAAAHNILFTYGPNFPGV